MRKFHSLARAAACAAALGSLVPTSALRAADLPAAVNVRHQPADVVLTNGALTGQFVTSTGAAVEGAKVSVRQAGREVAATSTDAKGVFQVPGMQSGVYEVVAGNRTEIVRTWNAESAPPSAKPYATIVSDNAIRGNDCCNTNCGPSYGLVYTALGVGVAGLATGIVALVEANKDHSP